MAASEPPPSGPRWLTRDEDSDGIVSRTVDVWTMRPARWRLTGDGGWVWIGPGDTGMEPREAQLSLADAERAYRTLPDDSLQVIRIGAFYGDDR